jgi:hypothetical protein
LPLFLKSGADVSYIFDAIRGYPENVPDSVLEFSENVVSRNFRNTGEHKEYILYLITNRLVNLEGDDISDLIYLGFIWNDSDIVNAAIAYGVEKFPYGRGFFDEAIEVANELNKIDFLHKVQDSEVWSLF